MKELANISTFNRLCRTVENTSADSMYADTLKNYDNNFAIPLQSGIITPKDARTPNGKLLMGQQIEYAALYRNLPVYKDYIARLKEFDHASKVFKNMWASAVKHGRCGEEIQNLRDRIADFEASINQFNQDVQHNQLYL